MQAARGASLTPEDAARDDTTDPATAPAARPGVSRRRLGLFIAVVAIAYAADLLTKTLAVAYLPGREPLTVVPEVLQLTFVRNAGAAFGMATGFTVVLSLVALAVCVAVGRLARRLQDTVWAAALGLLLGGALGNLTDRVFRAPGPLRGHVVDFLQLVHFPVIDFPVFNVADLCITTAAVLITVQSFRGLGVDGRRHAASKDAPGGSARRTT